MFRVNGGNPYRPCNQASVYRQDILLEYLQADEFKSVFLVLTRALAAIYVRMTFRPVDVYEILEPLLKDYRKLRYRHQCEDTLPFPFPHNISLHSLQLALTYMDEFIDQLLNEERVCDLILPRMAKREVLEKDGELAPRQSRLLAAMEGISRGSRSSHSARISPSAQSRSRSGSPSRDSGSESPVASRSPGRSVSPVGSDDPGTRD
ncbi:PRP38 family-domain-containing protein [Lactarius quietus]|nr:PRP38 family-domain-containing protein [Lactarius quietus]